MRNLFIFALIGTIFLVYEIEAGCLCKAKGSSLCNCDVSYVKPKPKPEVPNAAEPRTVCTTVQGGHEFHPIGDLCGCGRVHVEPAKVQPSCGCEKCQGNDESGSKSHDCSVSSLFEEGHKFERDFAGTQYDFAADADDQKPQEKPKKKKVADATSIVLALEEHKRCNCHVPEAKLHYGFFGKVKDAFAKKPKQDLKDGDLYKVVADPISLKKCSKHKKKDESEEESEEEEEVDEDEFVPLELGYADIGYGKHKYEEKSFTKHYGVEEKPETCKEHAKTKGRGCSCRNSKQHKHIFWY